MSATGKRRKRVRSKCGDEGPIWDPPELPHVEPGERDLLCQSATKIRVFGEYRAHLIFVDPMNPGPPFHHYLVLQFKTKSAQYYREWTIANGAEPRRHDRMALRVFVGKFFRVHVDWTQKDYTGRVLLPKEGYSRVMRIIERRS